VVATGRNAFAPFVAAGFISDFVHSTGVGKLTLARRYLDHKDARAKWTAGDELLAEVRAASAAAAAAAATAAAAAAAAAAAGTGDTEGAEGVGEGGDKRHFPWQTAAMGAKKMTAKAGKRKRGGGGGTGGGGSGGTGGDVDKGGNE